MRNEKYVYNKKQVGKYTVKVVNDDDPLNPREDFDNFGEMVFFHRRYNLGDTHHHTPDSLKEYLEENKDTVLWLPVYMYDHSGITISTGSFSCPWDSGQLGVILVTREQALEEFGGKRLTKKIKEKAYNLLEGEVKVYDQYLRGDVYGFIVEDSDGFHVDSCWGFFGDPEECLAEGVSVAEANIKYDIKKHIEEVKKWIKHRVPLYKRSPLSIA